MPDTDSCTGWGKERSLLEGKSRIRSTGGGIDHEDNTEVCPNGGLTKLSMQSSCNLRVWSDDTLLHRNTVSEKLKRKAVVS